MNGDVAHVRVLEAEIAATGGLSTYQLASTQGQANHRGGDTSRVLVEWLRSMSDTELTLKANVRNQAERKPNYDMLRLLEIGALSTRNACSSLPWLDVKRIDLQSCDKSGIEEIDFMEMPIPSEPSSKYHIISLSLVLNYVADPSERGDMLARLPVFMEGKSISQGHLSHASPSNVLLPLLFLVLPLACISNSRYLTETRFTEIMYTLGFRFIKKKESSKLYYSLWTHTGSSRQTTSLPLFKKEELRPGKSRNNFCIIL